MRKNNRKPTDDLRPEYDFRAMKGGVRGKYVKRYRAGTNLILLDPDLAKAFPNQAAVNDALRALLRLAESVRPPDSERTSHKQLRRSFAGG